MKYVTIPTNTDTLIYEGPQSADGGRVERQKRVTTVKITKNVDVATVTFGTVDSDGTFVAFKDGVVTEDSLINHSAGVQLWVNTSGIGSNPVEIGVST